MGVSERLAAWLLTGPIGHFVAGAADFFVLFRRLGAARLRKMLARARNRAGGRP